MIFWICLVAILAALALRLRQIYSKFSRHGVKNITPLPLLGNITRILLRMANPPEHIDQTYNAFPGERFVGTYEFTSPMILLRDIELVKKITIKDHEYFLDHTAIIDHMSDSLSGKTLFMLKGENWKKMRSTLSPTFSSSKLRLMVPFMVEVGDQMKEVLHNKIQESKDGYIDIDAKDMTMRYITDVIASCLFGIKVNSFTDERNEFYSITYLYAALTYKLFIIFLGYMHFPKIMNYFKITLPSTKAQDFIRNLVTSTMQMREERHIVRPDIIHLLMEVKKNNLLHDHIADHTADTDAGFATVEESAVGKRKHNRGWTDDDLIAQALLFFIAGYDVVSTAMSFLMHELAVNPDVQEKLVQEIKETDARNEGELDYNSIQQMKYLDMVVSEVLRRWMPSSSERVCTKDYNLGKPNDNCLEDYIIRKGESVRIPVWSFHHNPEYFPDPYKFDPERFSEQNKRNIKPYSYTPFGLGPRKCIGSQFALCAVKVMAYQLLKSIELSPAAKTQIPAKLSTNPFMNRIRGGHWVRLKARN